MSVLNDPEFRRLIKEDLVWSSNQAHPPESEHVKDIARLRKALRSAEQKLADNERWWQQEEIREGQPDYYKTAFDARARTTHNVLEEVRAALRAGKE